MKMERINIACTCDERFKIPLLVTLKSLAESANPARSYQVYIFMRHADADFEKLVRRTIQNDKFEFEVVSATVDERVKATPAGNFPLEAWYRLFSADLLPRSVRKLIYLDSDLLVRGDIEELWNHDVDGLLLRAVPWHLVKNIAHGRNLGIPTIDRYFNAGVLLINLQRWREINVTESFLKCYDEKSELFELADQDCLNIVAAGQWQELPQSWNTGHQFFVNRTMMDEPLAEKDYAEILGNVRIVHFTTILKPWLLSSRHPFQRDFMKILFSIRMDKWLPWFMKENILNGSAKPSGKLYLMNSAKTALFLLSQSLHLLKDVCIGGMR
jgi:lipopolysaccharide biosynthesis glycosyltransferase